MSLLDSLEKVSGESANKVGRESLDWFSDKYLFSLEYRLVEPDIMEDVSSRLFDLFSTCVNIDEFFTVKYNTAQNEQTNKTVKVTQSYFEIDVFFNYSYTNDTDALKFFSRVISSTRFISRRIGRVGVLSRGVIMVMLYRKDINGIAILNEPHTPGNLGIFGLFDSDYMKNVFHMLYLLRGCESDDFSKIEHEIKRIYWLELNHYELYRKFRTKNGYHYEYKFNDTGYVLKENTSDLCYADSHKINLTVNLRRADLRGRSLRELALRILLMNSFIAETTLDGHRIFSDSNVISLYTPASALSFCLSGAYHKERRWNMTGNLAEMGVMNEYVQHLYDSHVLDLNHDSEKMSENITNFVNSVKIEDIDVFIKKRATVNEHYKGINIL